MNDPTNKIATQNAEKCAPATAAVLAARGKQVSDKMPLLIGTRKVVRLAPPIDDGFRPFRVF